MKRAALVLTVSDSVHAGTREDASGPAVRASLEARGWLVRVLTVPDDEQKIAGALIAAADSNEISAIFTTGGTGIAPRDVTPEATRLVIEREIPGLGEVMRFEGRKFTPRAVLSRGFAGSRSGVLIVNLPGAPKGAVQSFESIADLIPHVIDLLNGRTEHEPAGETTMDRRTSEQ